MDYEELRRLQRLEKNSSDLAQIPQDFYTQLSEYVGALIKEYKATGSPKDIRLLENVVRVSRDIFQRRSQKMLLHALRTFKDDGGNLPAVIEIEKNCYQNVISSLENMNDEFEGVLVGERPVSGTEAQHEASKALEAIDKIEEEQSLNMVLVRIIQKVPKFVSSDMTEYGPFQARDLVKLPEKEALLLVEKGFAERV